MRWRAGSNSPGALEETGCIRQVPTCVDFGVRRAVHSEDGTGKESHQIRHTVLSVRLAQEKPKYYEAYLRGDYKSVTAAAIASV